MKIYNFPYNLLTVFIAGLLLIACQQQRTDSSQQMFAQVGNEYLTLEDAKQNIPDFVLAEDSINALQRYRKQWIRQQILLQEAKRLGLSQQEEVQQKIQKAREEVLREALKDYVLSNKRGNTEISDNEARSFYQANKEQFVLNEDFVRFRHLKTKTIKAARAARQDLLDAVPWPEVARKYGISPELAITESEQYWPISVALKDIDIMNRYLNIIGQSEISPIQRVNGIYHFVQLMDTKSEGEQPDLDWLMGQIKDWMRINNYRRNFSSYVQNLYLKAKSNNEVKTFNVLPTNTNSNSTAQDTLKSTSTNE